jgi:hypothetical protein
MTDYRSPPAAITSWLDCLSLAARGRISKHDIAALGEAIDAAVDNEMEAVKLAIDLAEEPPSPEDADPPSAPERIRVLGEQLRMWMRLAEANEAHVLKVAKERDAVVALLAQVTDGHFGTCEVKRKHCRTHNKPEPCPWGLACATVIAHGASKNESTPTE